MVQIVSTQIITSPPLKELQNLCPGQEVNITCRTTTGSGDTIHWHSEEYIGSGGAEIAFATFNSVGDNITRGRATAYLTRKLEGDTILESKLSFVASVNSTVTCSARSISTSNPAVIRIVHGMYIIYSII